MCAPGLFLGRNRLHNERKTIKPKAYFDLGRCKNSTQHFLRLTKIYIFNAFTENLTTIEKPNSITEYLQKMNFYSTLNFI